MSIYATLWKLKFPKFGDHHIGCEWIEVTAQGVPPHIGSPTPGMGYENVPFSELHQRICDALRGDRPAVTMETISPEGDVMIHYEDGTLRSVPKDKS